MEHSRSVRSVVVEAIILPLYLDNKIVSLLLVFSAIGSRPLARKLSLPQNYQQSRTPVAVLLAWSLPNYERQEWRSPVNKPIYRSVPYEPPSMSTRQSRRLCTMMRVLRFPQDLHEFMSRTTRTYCLWWEGGDGGPTVDNQKWETKTLKKVLQSCGAEDGGHDKDVRVVFIHVASVLTLHRLPNFLDRRSKRLEVCFYTYGTHHRVPPSLWGIRPIYLAGKSSSLHSVFLISSATHECNRWHRHIHPASPSRQPGHIAYKNQANCRSSPLGLLCAPNNGRDSVLVICWKG